MNEYDGWVGLGQGGVVFMLECVMFEVPVDSYSVGKWARIMGLKFWREDLMFLCLLMIMWFSIVK